MPHQKTNLSTWQDRNGRFFDDIPKLDPPAPLVVGSDVKPITVRPAAYGKGETKTHQRDS